MSRPIRGSWKAPKRRWTPNAPRPLYAPGQAPQGFGPAPAPPTPPRLAKVDPAEADRQAALYSLVSLVERWRPPPRSERDVRERVAERLSRWRWPVESAAPLIGTEGQALGAADFLCAEIGLAVLLRLSGAERETHRRMRACARDPRVEHVAAVVASPTAALPPLGDRLVGASVINLSQL